MARTLTVRDVRLKLGRRSATCVLHDAVAIYNLLKDKPFYGNMIDISIALGVSHQRVNRAIGYIRSAEWIEKFGWTIPFVPKGPGKKPWYVVRNAKDRKILYAGAVLEKRIALRKVEKILAHFELVKLLAKTKIEKDTAELQIVSLKHVINLMHLNGTP